MVLATECTLAVEPLFGTAKGVRGNLPPLRHARTLFLPMLTALGARVCRVEAPPAKEPEAGAGRGGAASWVQHEQCACPGVPFTLWAVCGFCSKTKRTSRSVHCSKRTSRVSSTVYEVCLACVGLAPPRLPM